ncbi:MAG: Hsp20/alpha crystallin family protein, partial [Thermoanaerobaculum sp.]
FRELESLSERMQALLESAFLAPSTLTSGAVTFPPVDVYESDDAVVVEAELPGVAAQAVHVELEGEKLVIFGVFGAETGAAEETLLRMERPRGRFNRVVPLPSPVVPPFEATLSRGVLAVRLRKAQGSPRSIHIAREGT